jgi:hypothetical protein
MAKIPLGVFFDLNSFSAARLYISLFLPDPTSSLNSDIFSQMNRRTFPVVLSAGAAVALTRPQLHADSAR